MQNRVKTVEQTKAYADAFNTQDIAAIGEMLDDENVVFSRQEQNSIVGKDLVLRRIRNLFWRADEQHYSLKLVNAIIDLGNTKARPCLLCLKNNVPVAVCVISCKINGKINAIAVLLTGDVVGSARATEPLPGQKKNQEETAVDDRKTLIDVTERYISSFNNRDLTQLGDLLDEHQVVFHRSDQAAIVGCKNILARIRDLYDRVDRHGQDLLVLNAIVDQDGKKAWPCTLGILDGTPVSVSVLTLNAKGLIHSIKVDLSPAILEKVRATEPMPEPKKRKLDLQQVLEREEWLKARMVKINKAMKKHGNVPHLVTKKMRVENQLEKIEFLKKKLS